MVYKLVIKAVVMVVLMAGISNYLLYVMTGKTPFSGTLTDFSLPSFSSVTPEIPAGKDTAYKWTDEQGVVHYSSSPPPDTNQPVKRIEVDPNTNLIQGVSVPAATPKTPNATAAPMIQPHSPGGAQQLINDAKDVQRMLDERFEQQKAIIDGQ